MRYLLLTTLLLSCMALAQEEVTQADEISLDRNKAGNPTISQTNKLAEPTTSTAQHQQTDLDFLRERARGSTKTQLNSRSCGDFTCPDGTNAACLDIGDKVCPGSAKCVDDGATCFDEYPCDSGSGFVCASEYDDVLSEYKDVVRQHDELASENVALREKRLAQKNCVLGASNLDDAKLCVR